MAQPKPENFVKQRQSALALIGWYFGPLGAVAKGEKPFNKDDAVRATSYLVPLSKMPWEGFVAGTENVNNTKAKPEIWSKAADFKESCRQHADRNGQTGAAGQRGRRSWLQRSSSAPSVAPARLVTTTSANNNRQQL